MVVRNFNDLMSPLDLSVDVLRSYAIFLLSVCANFLQQGNIQPLSRSSFFEGLVLRLREVVGASIGI